MLAQHFGPNVAPRLPKLLIRDNQDQISPGKHLLVINIVRNYLPQAKSYHLLRIQINKHR